MSASNTPHTQRQTTPALSSTETAVALIPPSWISHQVNSLRTYHDPAVDKWPAHVNLLYPFVNTDRLEDAAELLRSSITEHWSDDRVSGLDVDLNSPGSFTLKRGATSVHLAANPEAPGTKDLLSFQEKITNAFQRQQDERPFVPHLTIGQVKNPALLTDKAALLDPVRWRPEEIAIFCRDRETNNNNSNNDITENPEDDTTTSSSNRMKLWASIRLDRTAELTRFDGVPITDDAVDNAPTILQDSQVGSKIGPNTVTPGKTYQFDPNTALWTEATNVDGPPPEPEEPDNSTLTVSTYNVLADPRLPPPYERYEVLLKTLLSESSRADVIFLQETCDSFLQYILNDPGIRACYPYTTNAPPEQEGIPPLLSIRSTIGLSRFPFKWTLLPLGVAHKSALILEMNGMPKPRPSGQNALEDHRSLPVIVSSIHLSSGLYDRTMSLKRLEVMILLDYLRRVHPDNDHVVAGDFNITTSSFTIQNTVRNGTISPETSARISNIEELFTNANFVDSWNIFHTIRGRDVVYPQRNYHDLFDGEQGATFDPALNYLAAESARTSAGRPQRYDRVLFKDGATLQIEDFSMFGFSTKQLQQEQQDQGEIFGSDHWGVRASFRVRPNPSSSDSEESVVESAQKPVVIPVVEAHKSFRDAQAITSILEALSPPQQEAEKRQRAFALIKSILQQQEGLVQVQGDVSVSQTVRRASLPLVIVPVGSYGLGVWDSSSDVDCLCVGSISESTFFELAVQNLRRASHLGVRIKRKVTAAWGALLETDVDGTEVDVRYCPAAAIAERWSDVTRLPQSDTLFDLSPRVLEKLQPYRDAAYLQRTTPYPSTFRQLRFLLKSWAKQHGIYDKKFGYLGSASLTTLLSAFLKSLPPAEVAAAGSGSSERSVADLLRTFFRHYANFDWKNHIVYDPVFFQQQLPRYRRPRWEAMVALTIHHPMVNVTRAVTESTLPFILEEFRKADEVLGSEEARWGDLIGLDALAPSYSVVPTTAGASQFLKAYNTYVRIHVQYWGLSLLRGRTFLGWLESRCSFLLGALQRGVPGLQARIWPARFTSDGNATSDDDLEYDGCYLVGLARSNNVDGGGLSAEEKRFAQNALETSLLSFASRIREDEEYYDADSTWVDVSLVKRSEVASLVLDQRQWGKYSSTELEFGVNTGNTELDNLEIERKDPEEIPHRAKKPQKPADAKPLVTAKLRPASDILNRIRWDPNFDPANYIIGYDDRFTGVQEISASRWKADQTDIEFIPQHRILYFKEQIARSTRVIWDREEKIDALFGSGIGAGGGDTGDAAPRDE